MSKLKQKEYFKQVLRAVKNANNEEELNGIYNEIKDTLQYFSQGQINLIKEVGLKQLNNDRR